MVNKIPKIILHGLPHSAGDHEPVVTNSGSEFTLIKPHNLIWCQLYIVRGRLEEAAMKYIILDYVNTLTVMWVPEYDILIVCK